MHLNLVRIVAAAANAVEIVSWLAGRL